MKRSGNLNNPSDPWNLPPRRQHFDNHYFIKITVFDPKKDDEIVTEKVIDYGEYEDRKFLGRLTHFAMENFYVVETMRVEKD